MRDAVVEGQERSPQVHLERAIPFVRPQLVDRSPDAVNAGVGEYDVEAVETIDQFADTGFQRVRIRNIRAQWQSFAAGGLDLLGRLPDFGLGVAQRADPGSFPREPNRRRLADARTGARDQRDLPFQLHRTLPLNHAPTAPQPSENR